MQTKPDTQTEFEEHLGRKQEQSFLFAEAPSCDETILCEVSLNIQLACCNENKNHL